VHVRLKQDVFFYCGSICFNKKISHKTGFYFSTQFYYTCSKIRLTKKANPSPNWLYIVTKNLGSVDLEFESLTESDQKSLKVSIYSFPVCTVKIFGSTFGSVAFFP